VERGLTVALTRDSGIASVRFDIRVQDPCTSIVWRRLRTLSRSTEGQRSLADSRTTSGADAPIGFEAQRTPMQEIAQAIYALLPADCETVLFTVRMTDPFMQATVNANRADGSVAHLSLPLDVLDSVEELRASMYKPGVGAWFTANFTANQAGDVDATFDYDNEPDWAHAVDPLIYINDLKEFPRDDGHIPEWLRRDIAKSAAGVTAVGGHPL
jgi:hypothetical protein